jgi:UrcA family protein
MKSLALAIAFAFTAVTFSTVADAAPVTATAHVAHGDLQLSDARGRALLDRRLAQAIDISCGVDNEVRSLAERRAAKRCVLAKQAEVAPARAAALASYGVPERLAAAN